MRISKGSQDWMQKWRKGLERDVSEKCVFEIDQSCEAEEVTLSEEECKSVREFLDAHEKEPDKDLAVNVGSELWTWGPPSWLVLEAARERYREFVGRHRNDAAIRKLRTNEALTWKDQTELNALWAKVEPEWPEEINVNVFLRELFGMDQESMQRILYAGLGSGFLTDKQRMMLDLMVAALVKNGTLFDSELDRPPFTEHDHRGLRWAFSKKQYQALVRTLEEIYINAICLIQTH